MFGAAERLQFESLLHRLRLIFLLSMPLVLLARGPSAWPFAGLIGGAVLGSYAFVAFLLGRMPSAVLRYQLALRALDCVLVLAVLHPYHGSFGNAYYDSTGQLELDVAPLDLAELVRALTTDFQRANPSHDVVLRAPTHLPVDGDAVRLQQVLGNLLSNAVKFSLPESVIEVDLCATSANRARIGVRDHGPGIAPEHRERIFERYYQAGPQAGRGLGLGLYLSRQLVEAHGGTLRAEFPADGGTRMVIEIPSQLSALDIRQAAVGA